ncbi:MAG: prepilin-type N-terminal cleavage/methylation domain-containing protein [Steroidobacteraceae bacterium]|nr:prepilin-type N-terminal cleavage/methylation domain-containing protein [Steroidobacteraceae bacterium]
MTRLMERRTPGFTLIETLVALVVLSTGLLGSVALLLGSLRSQTESRRESEAIGLLSDVADRIRASVAACASVVPSVPCEPVTLVTLERSRFENAATVLYPDGDIAAAIDFAPATGAAPDRFVITLRRRQAAGVDVLSLQVHARALVAG